MNWLAFVLVAVFGFIIAAAIDGMLVRRRDRWSQPRRVVTAALVAPVLILLASGAGIMLAASQAAQPGGDMADLAAAALLTIGLAGAVTSFAAGVAGAILTDRALQP